MASHRKPRHHRAATGSTTARAAGAIALASAASATALGGLSHADPRPTAAEVKAKVDKLHHEAEKVTEEYNGVKEKAGKAERDLEAVRDEAARRTARLNAARNALGSFATAQYRSGTTDPAAQVALSSDPGSYLRQAALMERAGSRQASAVDGVAGQLRAVRQARTQARDELAAIERSRTELKKHKRTIEGKLAEARRLLDTLDSAQRADILAGDGHGGAAARAGRDTLRGPVRAPNARAAQAVAFAQSVVGRPYGWGATGPGAYDCSGLTQAAWRAAGVALPRTTYTQAGAGTPVSRSALAPGDLVFFYSGRSHVGIYVGGGQMIHAPRTGSSVGYAPLDQMPFAGAVRPA